MLKFFICRTCGNMIEIVKTKGVPVFCCGKPMEELTANTVEASAEKHLPEVTVSGGTVSVKVGSQEHPMLPEHYITMIVLETENGVFKKYLNAGEKPEAVFALAEGDKPVAVYEYCNLHGLWKTEIK